MGHGFKLFLLNFCHAVVRTMPDKPAPCYERALTPAAGINDARACGALNHCFINNLSAPLPFPESRAQWRRSLPDRCVSLRASLECDLQCTVCAPIRAACALSRRRSSSTKAAAQAQRPTTPTNELIEENAHVRCRHHLPNFMIERRENALPARLQPISLHLGLCGVTRTAPPVRQVDNAARIHFDVMNVEGIRCGFRVPLTTRCANVS
jgi:hypothetical protein